MRKLDDLTKRAVKLNIKPTTQNHEGVKSILINYNCVFPELFLKIRLIHSILLELRFNPDRYRLQYYT